ncbi:MAG: acyl carrier protein [Cyanobacteria bacterium P01_A01_bin.105]
MQQLQNSSSSEQAQNQATSPVQAIQQWLVSQLADVLSIDPSTIEASQPLTRYGLDSIDAVTLVGDLEDWLDLELPSTLLWDYPTIEKASTYLVQEFDVSV